MKSKRPVTVKLQLFEEGFRENCGWTAHIHESKGPVQGAIGTHEGQSGVDAIAVKNEGGRAGGGEGESAEKENGNEKQDGDFARRHRSP